MPSKNPSTPSEHPSLDESEELFRVLLDGTFEGILIHDSVIHYANDAAARITGYSREQLRGMRIRRLHADLSLDERPELFRPAAEGATYGPLLFTGVGEGARHASIEAQGKTIFYRDQWLWLTAFRDVSRARRTELELRQRVAFEDLVTSISATFINLPPDEVDGALDQALEKIARFEDVNRSYIYLLDGDTLQAINLWSDHGGVRGWKDRQVPVGDFRWAIERLDRGEAVIYEVTEKHPHPEHAEQRVDRTRSSACVPMHSAGKLFGYVGFDALRDAQMWPEDTIRLLRTVGNVFASVIERRRVQRALDDAYATMEQTVERRTAELRQKHGQLVQAEKMAALGQLVAGVAHEINTPLGAIKSNADTLQRTFERMGPALSTDDGGPDLAKANKLLEGSKKLNDINVQAIDRIAGIVASLRQFARLDQAEIDTLDLHEALENTLTLVHHQFKHRIEVERDYGEVPPIECHPQQINQVIMNLLVNAGQAIEGAGKVRIRTRLEGDVVVLEVQDSGKGIDSAYLERIFDPGFTTKGVGVGTGLGLSIVHQIVDEHRGTISVDSKAGAGATFVVRLPVKHADD